MKVFHVEARAKDVFSLPEELVGALPRSVALFCSVQFLSSLEFIKKQIFDAGKQVFLLELKHTCYEGQLLGCNVERFEKKVDAFVYVGDGLFHPKALVLKNDLPVFVFNPFSNKFFSLSKDDVSDLRKRSVLGVSSFFSFNKIGVLISTKQGQFALKKAELLKEKFPSKEFFFFLDNTFDFSSLEDFPFIEVWVNTACPRMAFDDSIKISKPIVNVDDVLFF